MEEEAVVAVDDEEAMPAAAPQEEAEPATGHSQQ